MGHSTGAISPRRFSSSPNRHEITISSYRESPLRVLEDIRIRFPDAQLSIDRIVAVDDQVIVLQTYSGTHRGIGRLPLNGGLLVGVAPSGRHFSVPHIHWYTLKQGLIVDHRAVRDDVGMMVQLGFIVPPAVPDPLWT